MRGLVSVLGGMFTLAVLVALVGFAVSARGTADQGKEVREPRDAPPVCGYPMREDNLEISECSHGRISGSYEDAGSVVSFSSRLAEDWSGPSPSRASPEDDPSKADPWVTARVEVNGKVFTWTDDTKRQRSVFDGPDASLTREDSRALVGAGNAVWRHALHGEIESWNRRSKLTLEQAWLTMALGYISEAPPGYKITDDTFGTGRQEKSSRGGEESRRTINEPPSRAGA